MSGALRELIAFFGIEVDDHKVDAFGEKLEGTHSLLEKVGATIGIAFGLHEISEFIQGQIELAVELGHTSEMLGIGVEDLQAFQYAAANAGLSSEEATTAIRFLNKNVGEAAGGSKEAAQAFASLGVHVKDSNGHVRGAQDILADVADGMEKLPSPAEKTAKAMQIFGRAGARLIPLLDKGGDGIEALYDEFEKLGGGINEDYVKVAEEAHHETLKLGVVWKGLKATIGNALIPAFGWLVNKAGEAVGWFREFTSHSYIVQTALATLGTIVGALVVIWGVLNFEVLLVVAAIALIILVVDDVYTAFKGGKSVIGDFIDSIFGVGTTQQVFVDLQNWAYKAWGVIEQISVSIAKAINGAIMLAAEVAHATHLLSDEDYALAKKTADAKGAELAKKGEAADFDANNNHIRQMVAFSRDVQEQPGGKPRSPVGFQRDTSYTPPAGAVAAAGGGPAQVTNHTTVNVDVATTGSPKEAGRAVAEGVKKVIADSDLSAGYAGAAGNGGF